MTGFFQVDRDIFTSSVWLASTPEEKVLWLWLLGNRDDDGVVRHRELAIAFGTGLPRVVIEAGLHKFLEPDSDSRTKANEGRRIDRTEDGFVRILNHELYYSKDYSTPRWKRWKERKGLRRPESVGKRVGPLANTVGNEGQGQGQGQGQRTTTELLPTYPPADQAERTIRKSTEMLRTKLYSHITEMSELDPKQREPTELMRLVTGYERSDGTHVRGVVNAGLLTHERLEKSIQDAEFWIEQWKGKGNGEK